MMMENELAASIAEKIAGAKTYGKFVDEAGGWSSVKCISFFQYMQACLYDPQYGYYRSGPIRVGKEGDFYTSSGIGQVLAEVLAKYVLDYAALVDKPLKLIEWGAGTGRLSAQIAAAGCERDLDWKSKIQPILIEDHPAHAEAARHAFADFSISGAEPLFSSSDDAWGETWLKQPTIVLANELFDAFPVHRVQLVNGELMELGVAYHDERGFVEVQMPLTDTRITNWLNRDHIQLLEGQQTEVHAGAVDFLNKLGAVMTKGRVVIIDYGHKAEEYAAEHRMLGTLMCYSRHQTNTNPYSRIGEQDITSHVPFTFIHHSAEESGFQVASYMTQKQFLIEHGVMDMLQNHNSTDPFSKEARRNRAIRQLLLSDQMSETFKVMVLEKG
ncbi:class I SAM-dependent methyltransferase [Paenibacillus sp. NRS-1760]|uniref:class I SAM-dependent methyltransferase n=1 Tax=Paenibacillus sp. NRS-1760 TaxID=3233902 RepID=UPI003D2D92DE